MRTAAGVVRMSKTMRVLAPGRIATVVDAVAQEGLLWTVTEPVDGVPLGELLVQQGTFGHVEVARIGLELLEVLEAAHSEGITHGELSPGQVFVHVVHGVSPWWDRWPGGPWSMTRGWTALLPRAFRRGLAPSRVGP